MDQLRAYRALPWGDAGVRSLSCAEQFCAMVFAQLTWRIRRARKLCASDSLGVELDNTVYALMPARRSNAASAPQRGSIGCDNGSSAAGLQRLAPDSPQPLAPLVQTLRVMRRHIAGPQQRGAANRAQPEKEFVFNRFHLGGVLGRH